MVREARRMLAEQLNVGESEVAIVGVEPRDWPDTSLGCPQPGLAYTQVITPGYRIVLAHGDQRYAYHAGARIVVACPSDRG